MAKTAIGTPIPRGDLPSLTEDTQSTTASSEVFPSQTENKETPSETGNLLSLSLDAQPGFIIADNLPAHVENMQAALPSPDTSPTSPWSDLIQMSWQLSMLPAVTWSSFYKASWKAWESAAQPQWPSR